MVRTAFSMEPTRIDLNTGRPLEQPSTLSQAADQLAQTAATEVVRTQDGIAFDKQAHCLPPAALAALAAHNEQRATGPTPQQVFGVAATYSLAGTSEVFLQK